MRKEKISEGRYFGASALAAAAPFGVVLGLGLLGFVSTSLWGTGTELDDAPMRVAGAFMFLSPIIYLIYFVALYLCSRILALFRMLSFASLSILSVGLITIAIYLQQSQIIGWRASVITEIKPFIIFWLVLSLFTLFTVYIWWKIAHNQSLKKGRRKAAPLS